MQLTIRLHNNNQPIDKTISDKSTTTIGRARDTQIRLEDRTVSRRHATISVKENQWYLRNISSSNLVRKGGQRIAPGSGVSLREGDIFQIGPFRFHAAVISNSRQRRNVPKLQCEHCNHIVEYKPHEFCPWCGRSLANSLAITIRVEPPEERK